MFDKKCITFAASFSLKIMSAIMNLNQLVEAVDAQVVTGDIINAFNQFAAENCVTLSNPQDKTHTKAQKLEVLHWFFDNVASINRIERPAFLVKGDNQTESQFVFDFTNRQGNPMVFSEVIRRTWAKGKIVEELYLVGQTLDGASAPAEAPAKKSVKTTANESTEIVADKKPATKNAEATKKSTVQASVPTEVKADDLTLIEGIGPKIAELLIAGGISTFKELAAAKPAAVKAVLDAAGKRYQMHDPATWPKQAALARDGKSAELAKLQGELKAGK